MAARVIRIPDLPERKESPEEPETSTAGWDPYEVWRTRVLLPRLEQMEPEPAVQIKLSGRSFLNRLRRLGRARKG